MHLARRNKNLNNSNRGQASILDASLLEASLLEASLFEFKTLRCQASSRPASLKCVLWQTVEPAMLLCYAMVLECCSYLVINKYHII